MYYNSDGEKMKENKIEGLEDSHPEIFRDVEKYARAGNIMPKYILNSMLPYLGKGEAELYKHFSKSMDNLAGVLYTGEVDDIHAKFSAIAGFFIRNYRNARLVMSGQISMKGEDSRCRDCRIMLVPDLLLKGSDLNIPEWRVADIVSVFYHRASHNRPTIVYVEDWDLFGSTYGKLFENHLDNFLKVKVEI